MKKKGLFWCANIWSNTKQMQIVGTDYLFCQSKNVNMYQMYETFTEKKWLIIICHCNKSNFNKAQRQSIWNKRELDEGTQESNQQQQ